MNQKSLYLIWGTEMSQNPLDIVRVRDMIKSYGFQVKNFLWDTRTANFINNTQEEGIANLSPESSVVIVPRETIPRELLSYIPENTNPNIGTLALIYALYERCSKILVVDFPGNIEYAKEYDLPNVMLISHRANADVYVSGFRNFFGSK